MYIVVAILLFSFLIFIHELGHFVTAKLSGVKVNEFALFMGPKLLSKTVGETTYRLNLIPFGGYCAMEGEDGDSDNPRSFGMAKVWKRVVILCAGSFMNFLAGFLILLLLTTFSLQAIPMPTVTDLEPTSDLATAGLQVGDEFLKIDGKSVYIADDVSMLLGRNTTGIYDLTVLRDGEKVELNQISAAKKDFGDGTKRLGVSFTTWEEKNVGNVLRYSWNNCRYFARLVWISLGDLISGRASMKDVGGPVEIVKIVNDAGQQADTTSDGLLNTLYLFAFIAVNLAVMNMLPIPALDGGRVFTLLVVCAIEKITRKKLNPKYEGYIHAAGMVILLGFMAIVTIKDIVGLFQ